MNKNKKEIFKLIHLTPKAKYGSGKLYEDEFTKMESDRLDREQEIAKMAKTTPAARKTYLRE